MVLFIICIGMESNIVPLNLNAFTLREVAEAWGCSERTIIQLAIDEKIRLATHKKIGTFYLLDGDGEVIDDDLGCMLSQYIYLQSEDISDIEKNGEVEISVFWDDEEAPYTFEKPFLVKLDHLRVTAKERKRLEQVLSQEYKDNRNIDKWPWGSYENEYLRVLSAAVSEFFDPRRTPDAKKEEVSEWIKEKLREAGAGSSDRVAEAIFTIIKPIDHNPKKGGQAEGLNPKTQE